MRAAVPGRRAWMLALLAAGCGPYANVAQKLDVTARVAGDTWIAKGGADEIRVLIVGTPTAEGTAPFSFSSAWVPISAGKSVTTLQGTWIEVGSAGAATLGVEHESDYPDETGQDVLSRTGTTRSDDHFTIQLTVSRAAGQLVVSGDARIAGTYVALTEALGLLGDSTERDAACAFQLANVGMLRSEGRIIGFGGAGVTQYQQAESYIGTVAGSMQIAASLGGGWPPSNSTVTMDYYAYEDVGGVTVSGPMITFADSSGSGHMSGVMSLELAPVAADGTPGPKISGSIDYGANAVQITNGDPSGGYYTVALAGGGSAMVPVATAPNPSVADCLSLP